jgi:hypothetical protein
VTRSRDHVVAPDPQRLERWAREAVQRHADDVVLTAALFKPNAPGSFDVSPAGFGDRQLLKARGAYLGERILLGATPLDVYALVVFANGRIRHLVARWPRAGIVVSRVSAKRHRHEPRDPTWPALLITSYGRTLAELQAIDRTDAAERLVDLLCAGCSLLPDHR